MKVSNSTLKKFLILLAFTSTLVLTLKIRPYIITPKANDLLDHFGTEPVADVYGPKEGILSPGLAREGVVGPETPITPIRNLTQEINPYEVNSGDLDNTAFDASKIVRPELAAPKMDIRTTITHEAVVNTPVHMGNQYEENTSKTMDRTTGQEIRKTTVTEKPIVGVLKTVKEVKTDHETMVDIRNGQLINMFKNTTYLGK